MASLIGKTLKDRYRVDELLGRGGMAEVYKVFDLQRGVPLAMKVLREDLAEDRVFLRRFQREARNLSKLQHPNIVRFYGLEQEGPLAFILMDYIQGQTLRRIIFDVPEPLKYEKVLEIMQPVCSALHYAHQQGIVHCDLKSANIMLDKNGKVYLTDFGIARLTDSATSTMVGIGTPAYMAPELIQGKDPTPQTDIYSLGIVLYEMLTGGERPFIGEHAQTTGTTAEKVRWEHLNRDVPSILKFNKAVDKNLDLLVKKCLVKIPEDRFSNIGELIEALSNPDNIEVLRINKKDKDHVIHNQQSMVEDECSRSDDNKGKQRRKNNYIGIAIIAVIVFAIILNTDLGENITSTFRQPTATVTRVPTRTPKPKTPTPTCKINSPYKSNWKIQICEDFSRDTGLFYTGTGSDELINETVAIQNGKYTWDISGKATSGYQSGVVRWADVGMANEFVISIDGRIESIYKECGWGIAFRGQDNGFYLFQIQHNGYYSLDMLDEKGWTPLISWHAHNSIKWDESNNITVIGEGDNFEFYINDVLVNSYESSYLDGSALYLVVTASEGASAIIGFDDLLIKKP